MKTVLKATKRFAAVFLAMAMVVLSLPSSLMTVYANTTASGTIAIGTHDHATLTIAGGETNYTIQPADESVAVAAAASGGYKITALEMSGGSATFTDQTGLSVGSTTGTVAVANGDNGTNTMNVTTAAVSQKITASAESGNTVTMDFEGNSSPVTGATGITKTATDNKYVEIYVEPAAGKMFTDAALNESTGAIATGDDETVVHVAAGSTASKLTFQIPATWFTTPTVHADREVNFAITGDATASVTGTITNTTNTNTTVTGVTDGAAAAIVDGKVSFTVTPNAGYVVVDSDVSVQAGGAGDSIAVRQAGQDNTGFGGRNEGTVYEFPATANTAYTIATEAKSIPRVGTYTAASHFTGNLNGGSITAGAVGTGTTLAEGENTLTLTRTDAGYELSSVSVSDGTSTQNLDITGKEESGGDFTFYVPSGSEGLGKAWTIAVVEKTTDASEAIAIAGSSSINVAAGAAIDESYTVTKNSIAYTNVTWSIYDSESKLVTSIPGVTIDTSKAGTLTLSGNPSKVASTTYTIYAKDNATGGKTGQKAITWAVTDRDADFKWTKGSTNASFDTTQNTTSLTGFTGKAGYTSIASKTIQIKNTSSTTALAIDKIELTGANSESFTISGTSVTSLAATKTATLTVAPVTGLEAGTYNAVVTVTSSMLSAAKEIATVQVVITDEIALSLTGASSGASAEPTANASTNAGSSGRNNEGDINLGTYAVGETVSALKITASGTASNIKWSAVDGAKLPAGLSASGAGANYITISGTPTAAAYDSSITATLTDEATANPHNDVVYDSTGKTTIYYIPLTVNYSTGSSKTYTGVLKIKAADLSYSIGSDALTSGEEYTTSGSTVADGRITVTITNSGKSDVILTATDGANKFTATPTFGSDIEVKAGKTATVTIEPQSAAADGSSLITFSGKSSQGADAFTINKLNFYQLTSYPRITTPAEDDPSTGSAVSSTAFTIPTDAILGSYYSYRFAAGCTNTSEDITWSLAAAGEALSATNKLTDGTTNKNDGKVADVDVNIASELSALGLYLSSDGLLYGTPKVKDTTGKIIAIKATQGDNSVIGYYKLVIKGAEKALTLSTSDGVIPETGLSFQTTTDGKKIETTVTIRNTSSIDLAGVTVALASSDAAFAGTTMAATAIKANSSATFKAVVVAGLTAGTHSDTVQVKDADGAVIASFPIRAVVTQAPTITNSNAIETGLSVNTPIASPIQLAATDRQGNVIATEDARWSWDPTSSDDSLVPGLNLSTDGKVTGTPTAAGTYKVTLTVVDTSDENASGSKDISIAISTTGEVTLQYGAGTNLATANNGLYNFAGVVKDAAAPDVLAVTVYNSGSLDLSNLSITLKDAAGVDANDHPLFTGSKDMFTLSTTSISSIAKGQTASFSIRPNSTAKAGTYRAYVTVKSDQIAATSFTVQYIVVNELNLSVPAVSDLTGMVGEAYEYQLVASGAGIKYQTDGVTLETVDDNQQSVSWYLTEDTASALTTKKTNLTAKAGIASTIFDTNTTGVTDNNGTALNVYALGTAGNGNGAIASAKLANTGDYEFTVLAQASTTGAFTGSYIDANGATKNSTTIIVAPKQTKTMDLTLVVDKTGKVFASAMTDNNGTPETKTARDITGDGKKDTEVTGYTFENQPVGYNDASVADTISVKNASAIAASVTATVTNDDGSETPYFVVPATKTTIGAGVTNSTTWEVKPAASLAAGTYKSKLVFSGDNFETITVPLTLTVESAKYTFDVYAGAAPAENEQPVADNTINLDAVAKGDSLTYQNFRIKNSGNVNLTNVKVWEVMDAEGTEFGTDKSGMALAEIQNEDSADFANNSRTVNRDASTALKIKQKSSATAGNYTAYFKVQATYNTNTVEKIYTVNYTVLNSALTDVTVNPSESTITLDEAKEGYTASGSAKQFTYKNNNSTALDTLTGVMVKLEGSNAAKFVISSEDGKKTSDVLYTMDSLANGASASFTVSPVEGLSYGSYDATLVFSAKNLKTDIRTNLIFNVTADNTAYTVTANADEYTIPSGFGARVLGTIDKIAEDDGTKYPTIGVYESNANLYYVNLTSKTKPTGNSDADLAIRNSTGTYTVAKLRDTNFTKSSYTLALTSADATAVGNGGYKSLTINIVEKVTFDVTTGSKQYVNKTTGDPANYTQNVIYYVPWGENLTKGTGDSNNENGYTGAFTEFPEVYSTSKYVDYWFTTSGDVIGASTLIKTDVITKPHEHTHTYPAAIEKGDNDYIKWTWMGSASDNYKGTYVTIYCTDTCPDAENGALKLDASVLEASVTATCEVDGSVSYTATATNNGITYKDVKEDTVTPAVGHTWVYDFTKLTEWTWDASTNNYTISAWRKCTSTAHNTAKDGDAAGWVAATVTSKSDDATCKTTGTVVYTATWTDEKSGAVLHTETKTVTGVTIPHTYTKDAEFNWSNWMTDHTVSSIPAVFTCDVCGETATVAATITSKAGNNGSTVYTATATISGRTGDLTSTSSKTVTKNGKVSDYTVSYDTDEFTYDGTAKTLTHLNVFWGTELLTLNKDYTVKYAFNKDAGTGTATITGKGNYQKTKDIALTINRRSLTEASTTSFTKKATAKNPNPKVTWNGKTLKQGTDYEINDALSDYTSNPQVIVVSGLGNFTDTAAYLVYSVDGTTVKDIAGVTVTVDTRNMKAITATGEEVLPNFTVKYKSTSKVVTPTSSIGSIEDTPFSYVFSGNTKAGTATLQLIADPSDETSFGGQRFGGIKTVSFKIPGLKITKEMVSGLSDVEYTGEEFTVENFPQFAIKNGDATLTEGTDYTLSYKNNIKAGTATVTVTGIGAYTGAKYNATFKITKPDITNGEKYTVVFAEALEEYPFTQGGVKPEVLVTEIATGKVLALNTDYTVTYAKNTKPGAATATVKAKGNYQNLASRTGVVLNYTIGNAALSYGEDGTVYENRVDVKYSKNVFGSYITKKPVLVDASTGKNLTVGRDYEFAGWSLTDGGDVITNKNQTFNWPDYADTGLTLFAKVKGLGNYGKDADYIWIPAMMIYQTQLNARNFTAIADQVYQNGAYVEITKDDVTISGITAEDYEIFTYKNNYNKGTATVTLRGTGKFGGSVNKTFKITPASIADE